MNKEKGYTLLIFSLSLVIVIAGWIFTKSMLLQKENNILSQKGELYVGSSNLELFDNGQDSEWDEADNENIYTQNSLTEREIGEILTVWEMGGKEMPHEPRAGQLDMEQAIDVGKDWTAAMSEQGILPPDLAGGDFDNVSAKLLSRETQTVQDEIMLSYWSVQFTKGDTAIQLIIHAVCGEIWRAEITVRGDDNKLSEYKDEELVRYAFPFIEGGKEQVKIENITYQSLGEGIVYAAVMRSFTVVGEEEPLLHVNLWLCAGTGLKAAA